MGFNSLGRQYPFLVVIAGIAVLALGLFRGQPIAIAAGVLILALGAYRFVTGR